jgi:hypothetical protein
VVPPRVVRIPRETTARAPPSEDASAPKVVGAEAGRRPNVGGSQRAVRLALVYLLALTAVYLAFVLYARSTPGGMTSGAGSALLLFSAAAAGFGAVGAVLALHPAPRAVEISRSQIVVLGRWGGRRRWPRSRELHVRVVRRFPPRGLSSVTVELVEVSTPGRAARNYLVEEGLLPVSDATA